MRKKPPKRLATSDEIIRHLKNEMWKGKAVKKTSIELPLFLWTRAKLIAVEKDIDLRDIIIDALGKWVRAEMGISEEEWQRRISDAR